MNFEEKYHALAEAVQEFLVFDNTVENPSETPGSSYSAMLDYETKKLELTERISAEMPDRYHAGGAL